MTHAELRSLALAILAAFVAILLLSACETGPSPHHTARCLPAYEPPVAQADFQSVRTTAYTHTEADHTVYRNRNALGGELQAASAPNRRAENTTHPFPAALSESSDYRQLSDAGTPLQSFALQTRTVTKTTKVTRTTRGGKKVVVTKARTPRVGSAAADWSRWPAGTTFRVLSTGQMYRIEDYGWALSGRNTIDLYMATPRDMNSWGVRSEPIQVIHWGDRQESLRLLQPHRASRHIQRMMLELEGRDQEAAALQ